MRSLFVFVVLLGLMSSVHSQTSGLRSGGKHKSPVPSKSAAQRSSEFSKKLQLSPAQEKRITEILKAGYEKLKKLANDSKVSESARKSKIEAYRKETNQQIRSVLTAKQKKIFDNMLAEAAKRRADRIRSAPKPKSKPPAH